MTGITAHCQVKDIPSATFEDRLTMVVPKNKGSEKV